MRTPDPSLVLVGHGSRDPRSAAALARLTDRVRSDRPGIDVRLAFLELSVPSIDRVLVGLDGPAVVVPLLLGAAYHARIDLPARLAAAAKVNRHVPSEAARTLGFDPLLDDVLASTADRSGVDGYLLLATGSSHPAANDEVHERAGRLARRIGLPVAAGFVTTEPSVADAADRLRADGSRRPAGLPWFLSPGRLLDRGFDQAESAGIHDFAGPLTDDPRLARVVLSRYDEWRGLRTAVDDDRLTIAR